MEDYLCIQGKKYIVFIGNFNNNKLDNEFKMRYFIFITGTDLIYHTRCCYMIVMALCMKHDTENNVFNGKCPHILQQAERFYKAK